MSTANTRSPNYPATTLQEAIEKARAVWTHAKRSEIAVEALAKYWNYGPKSSGWRLSLAALKRFGLLANVGNKISGKVKLTDLATRILLDVRDSSPERAAAIKLAALTPPIYADLWNHWEGSLPTDDVIGTYLVMNKDFNEGAVAGFIKDFRKTISFASLTPIDRIEPAYGDSPNGDPANGEGDDPPERQFRRHPVQAGIKEDIFTLDEGQVVLQWPERLSKESFEDFESWLQLVIRKAKRSIATDEGDSE